MQNSSSNLRSAAAMAATRRASANAGESRTSGLERETNLLRSHGRGNDRTISNDRKNNEKHVKEESVISIDDSDNESNEVAGSKKSSKKGKLPHKKRARIPNSSNDADVIDLCDSSDND